MACPWPVVLRCLPDTEGWRGKIVASPMTGWPYRLPLENLRVEPAGRCFQEFLQRYYKVSASSFTTLDVPLPDDETITEEDEAQSAREHKKKTHHTPATSEDPYVLLGLDHRRWMATEEEIKKAYRKAVLSHHPDKKSDEVVGDEDDAMFKMIQRAYELLTNPRKRRAFDSEEPFDDSIPSSFLSSSADFYATYGPVFLRNARWSVKQPVPLLGDESTPYEEVVDFYDFWFSFSSWRDFSFEDEYDPEEADSREEKRWMERQNERQRARMKKEEQIRINALVSNAHKKDPRIKKHQEKLKDEKKKKREEQFALRRKVQEEQERKEALEREQKEREEKAKLDEAKKKTKALRNARATLRRLCREHNVSVSTTDLDTLCSKLELAQMKALSQSIQANPGSALTTLQLELESLLREEQSKRGDGVSQQQMKENEKSPTVGESKGGAAWTEEELALLAQATAKFPGGTGSRWRLIAQFINDKTGGNRSVKEIVAITQEIKKKADLHGTATTTPIVTSDPYDRWKAHKKTDTSSAGPIDSVSRRWDVTAPPPSEPATATTTVPGATPKPAAKPVPSKSVTTTSTSTTTAPATSVTNEVAPKSAAIQPAQTSEWTQEQQKNLEAAMKAFPASLGPKRWESIAAAIPGKTKKECVERYKHLVELYKANPSPQTK